MRPGSIVNFERCYLAAIALNVINNILLWRTASAGFAATGMSSAAGTNTLLITTVLGLVVNALLWYFIAKRGSVVAKWILTVLLVLGVIGLAVTYSRGLAPGGIPGIITIVSLVLQAVAVYLLFKPDSARWFAGKGNLENTFS